MAKIKLTELLKELRPIIVGREIHGYDSTLQEGSYVKVKEGALIELFEKLGLIELELTQDEIWEAAISHFGLHGVSSSDKKRAIEQLKKLYQIKEKQ